VRSQPLARFVDFTRFRLWNIRNRQVAEGGGEGERGGGEGSVEIDGEKKPKGFYPTAMAERRIFSRYVGQRFLSRRFPLPVPAAPPLFPPPVMPDETRGPSATTTTASSRKSANASCLPAFSSGCHDDKLLPRTRKFAKAVHSTRISSWPNVARSYPPPVASRIRFS